MLRRYAAFQTSSSRPACRASMVASSTPAGFSIPTSTSPKAAPSGGRPRATPCAHRAGDQRRRRQAAAAGHRHRAMPRLRREIAHRDVARALRRADDAHFRDRLALGEFVGRHRPAAGALQPHAQAGLDPHRAQRRHEVAIGLQRLDRLVRRLAEIGGARDHHRHRHIDAGDRVAGRSRPPARPVGSSLPVLAPTGLARNRSTPGNAPSTPGISRRDEPAIARRPACASPRSRRCWC